ncbi:sugar 3,4-ketoisomerase [Saccharomonospora halophila]|uniref:sugar 3,4-ketoisomerase n=1 Tax=Saccharomonospora halophila TaxID=129922 RepID=UPI00035C7352|nr:FdtA/QdtA family cupin domain-containing protein [Saccharomonospora halophila]
MSARLSHPGTEPGRVEPCRLLEFDEHADPRGSLSVVETGKDIDFEIKRVYYLYGLPVATVRGAHGHRCLRQVVIALHGQFEITVDDGHTRGRYLLDTPRRGLFIGPMTWRNLINFSPGAVGLVLASEIYDESDYYRNYDEFVLAARALR